MTSISWPHTFFTQRCSSCHRLRHFMGIKYWIILHVEHNLRNNFLVSYHAYWISPELPPTEPLARRTQPWSACCAMLTFPFSPQLNQLWVFRQTKSIFVCWFIASDSLPSDSVSNAIKISLLHRREIVASFLGKIFDIVVNKIPHAMTLLIIWWNFEGVSCAEIWTCRF